MLEKIEKFYATNGVEFNQVEQFNLSQFNCKKNNQIYLNIKFPETEMDTGRI